MNYYNREQIREIFGISTTKLNRWLKDGLPIVERTKAWKIDLVEVIRWYLAEQSKNMDAQRLRKLTFEADITEFEAKEKEGELVQASIITKQVANEYTVIKQRFLSMPDKLAPLLIQITDEGEMKEALLDEVRETLEELSSG